MIESRMGKLKKTEDNSSKYKSFRPKLGDTFPRCKQEKNNTDGRTRTLDFGWVHNLFSNTFFNTPLCESLDKCSLWSPFLKDI